MALDSEKILFQLAIKGADPAQVDAAARLTSEQLNRSMRIGYDKLRKLHAELEKDLTADKVKGVNARIKEEEKILAVMEKIRRASEIQSNKENNPFAGIMGSLQGVKNVLHISGLIAESVGAGIEKFQQLAAEIVRTTQVYGALKGSIEAAKIATGGEVANLDLIIAKNKSAQLEMNLTDAQFGIIAESAKLFADAVGTDTADALDQLVTGLGTAREKTLKLMGVFLDSKQLYKDLAESRGVSIDDLTEEEKRTAFLAEGLRLLNVKLTHTTEGADTFANALERSMTGLKNMKTETLAAVGSSTALGAAWEYWTMQLRISGEIMAGTLTLGLSEFYYSAERTKEAALEEARAFTLLGREAKIAAEQINKLNAAHADIREYLSPLLGMGGEMEPGGQEVGRYDAAAELMKTPEEREAAGRRQKYRKEMRKYEKKKGGGRKKKDNTADQRMLDELLFGTSGGASGTNRKALAGTDALYDYSTSAEDLGKLSDQAMQGFNDSFADEIALLQKTASDRLGAAGLDKGGIMASVIFGPEGSEGWETLIADTSDATLESLGMISEAGMQMAAAVGESLAALTAGDDTNLAKQTRAILKSLSTIAYTKALMSTAEGFAALANPVTAPLAAGYFRAAAAFGLVGISAGLGARAMGSDGAGASPPPATPRRRGSEFAGSGGRGGGAGGGGDTININIGNIYPGGEAEAGRQVQKALDAWKAKSGRGVN